MLSPYLVLDDLGEVSNKEWYVIRTAMGIFAKLSETGVYPILSRWLQTPILLVSGKTSDIMPISTNSSSYNVEVYILSQMVHRTFCDDRINYIAYQCAL